MSTNRLYDSLLSLPLFLGMTRYDFQNVAGKTRFDFQKLEAGETIVEEGTSCTRLYYLISGDIKVITQADDYGYQVEEDISAPESFQLERLLVLPSVSPTLMWQRTAAASCQSANKRS